MDGSFLYTPDPGFFGVDTFGYMMLGIPGLQAEPELVDTAVVTILVHPYTQLFIPLIIQ
jgi:hypothetical protein